MPKTFYTERDIEDLVARGVRSLAVSDEVVVTDVAREKARKLGLELVAAHDTPSSAPVRPYIAKQVAKPQPAPSAPPEEDLHARVRDAVVARLGDQVDPKLLDTIIRRVLGSIKTS